MGSATQTLSQIKSRDIIGRIKQHFMTTDEEEEGNVLFNDTLNTFCLWLNGVRHMIKDQLDSERGNLLPQHGLLFLISSMGCFICIIHRQNSTYHGLCYNICGAMAEMRNSSP